MKLLIITHDTKPTSGWGRQAMMIAGEYDKLGIDYAILSEKGRYESSAHETQVLLPSDSYASIFRNMWRVWRLTRGGYDVVHTLDVWPYGLYGYAAAFGTHAKLFLNGVGTYSVAPLYAPVKRLMLQIVFARTSMIFCISDYTMREMLRAELSLKDKLVTVPLGANALPLPSDADKDRVRSLFNIIGGPIILTVGAIKGRKGQLDTLEAVSVLKKKYPDILYLIVGSSDDKVYVERIRTYARRHDLEQNLRIIDSIKDDRDLAILYELADIFALNSNTDEKGHHFEGFGLVVVEAYQFGKPAVGSNNSGIESAIQDNVTGLLTQQRNPQDIADKIDSILGKYDSFSKNAKARYNAFDWKKTVASYIEFYKK